MTDAKISQAYPFSLGINVLGGHNGKIQIAYAPSGDYVTPGTHPERMEWVRKSYERFLEKVLEKELLLSAPPVDFS